MPNTYTLRVGVAAALSLSAAAGSFAVTGTAASLTEGSGAPSPSGSIRYDMRAGGAHSIQSATTMAAAKTASGFSEFSNFSSPYIVDFTADMDGAGKRAFRFNWKDLSGASIPNDEHDLNLERGTGSLGITAGDIYIQWKMRHGETSSGGGVGSVGSFIMYGGRTGGAGKRLVWFRAGDSQQGRITLAPGLQGDGMSIFVDGDPAQGSGGSSGPWPGQIEADVPIDWEDFINQDVKLTMRFGPSSNDDTADGTLEVWFNDTLVHSRIGNILIGPLALSGTLQLGGPTWIQPQQDQTTYLWDVVIWQL